MYRGLMRILMHRSVGPVEGGMGREINGENKKKRIKTEEIKKICIDSSEVGSDLSDLSAGNKRLS